MSTTTINHSEITQSQFGDNSIMNLNLDNKNKDISKDEFVKLLKQFNQELFQINIESKYVNSITSDMVAIQNEVTELKPDRNIIDNKLNGINLVLEKTNKAMDTAGKGSDAIIKLLGIGKKLVTAASLLF